MNINPMYGVNNYLANYQASHKTRDGDSTTTSVFNGQDTFTISHHFPVIDSPAKNPVDSSKNAIELKPNVVYLLGSVNGEPLKVRYFSGGGFETNRSLRINFGATGTQVTPEHILARKIFDSYTPQERQQTSNLAASLLELVWVADGKLSLEKYNSGIDNRTPLEDVANMIGIDLSRPFFVNGKQFSFQDGVLKQVP